ncbi:4-hydroxy-3-polyprenylbenzoate decarboxylase [Seinonella peptonophila]|uniref:Flavin prenyltransferase UbiX n=1 Tax=Seinonella peptonophila TaxID=112248 RepID=A0A1M4TVQ7_9BACL|nr:UbiX family flavin prenyltransferase [Seinonella peptonophila]SHE48530.1 4-hydroxy-3-polyprenylbenzoate decarboxylase [Seinonella peptonophila]
MKQRMIVGISGATGIIYGIKLLKTLKELGIETHLVISKAAEMTLHYETDMTVKELRGLADITYPIQDVGAAIASGSFQAMGMIVAPCSVHTLSAIANSLSNQLLVRAADVTLKERRRLVLLLRETPFTIGHIKNMLAVTENGGIIAPPVPAFYTKPSSLDEMVEHTIGRVLDLFGIDTGKLHRWGEES